MSEVPNRDKVIGIDLGTTYSCVAVWKGGKVEIIANDQGVNITPSVVAYVQDERLVGESAKRQIIRNAANTVFDAKRLVGRNYSDQIVQDDKKLWTFKVEKGPQDKPLIPVQYMGDTKKLENS